MVGRRKENSLEKIFPKMDWRAERALVVPKRRARGEKIGEGGHGSVYALKATDKLVVKVVPSRALANPLRELAIHRRVSRLVERGLTDHVAVIAGARRTRGEVHMYLERFDSSLYDWLKSGRASDGALRSVVLQALHGYYVAQRELGLYQSDFNETNVLVKRTSVPRVWVWVVDGREYSAESHGYLACLADFGASDIRGVPPLGTPLTETQQASRAHFEAMAPIEFVDHVVSLAIRCKVRGAFVATLARILYDHVLYQRSDEDPPSTSISIFAPTATRAPLSVARVFALCCA